LQLYQRILDGKREKDQPSLRHAQLKLSGLVKRDEEGCLAVRNRLYGRLFDLAWVRSTQPVKSAQRYRRVTWAATAALLAAIVGGGGYYVSVVQPQQALLNARQALESLKVGIDASGEEVIHFSFPGDTTNEQFVQAAPHIRVVGENTPNVHAVGLDLSFTEVSDLKPVAGLTNLQQLAVSFTQVSDLKPVTGLTSLRALYAERTKVTDVTMLQQLPRLIELRVSNAAGFRVQGIERFQNRSRSLEGIVQPPPSGLRVR
jgi:hypothetical protein